MDDKSAEHRSREIRHPFGEDGRITGWLHAVDMWFEQLKKRHVARVGVAYVVCFWVVIQIFDVMFPILNVPKEILPKILAVGTAGFVTAIILAGTFPAVRKNSEEGDPDPGYVAFIVALAMLICVMALACLIILQRIG